MSVHKRIKKQLRAFQEVRTNTSKGEYTVRAYKLDDIRDATVEDFEDDYRSRYPDATEDEVKEQGRLLYERAMVAVEGVDTGVSSPGGDS